MVYAMDTLGYAQRLRDAGVSQQQAEAHAEAARDFIMAELVTRNDLQAGLEASRKDLQAGLEAARKDLQAGLEAARKDLQAGIEAVRKDLQAVEAKLESKIDTQSLRLTVRLGGLLAAGIAILAGILKLA